MKLAAINKCTGCQSCAAICPKGCIHMEWDAEGFLYPVVAEDLCINCGLCEVKCPVLRLSEHKDENTMAYATYSLDNELRRDSTSGGVFSLLAQTVLQKNGIVFGAAYNPDFSVSHQYTETEDGLQRFRGAKYVQSDIGKSYRQVRSFLNENRYVLFSGTPCQIAGLQSYLGKDYEKLICVDLICHGIPSPEVWQHYIDYRAQVDNNGIRPEYINLRSKTTGWQRYSVIMFWSLPHFCDVRSTFSNSISPFSSLVSWKSCEPGFEVNARTITHAPSYDRKGDTLSSPM